MQANVAGAWLEQGLACLLPAGISAGGGFSISVGSVEYLTPVQEVRVVLLCARRDSRLRDVRDTIIRALSELYRVWLS
jgi:hypothetical protein